MGAHELSALLWQERELLELLVFKLEEEQLLLTAGRTRWLQHATREVEQVLERLRSAGLARTVEVSALAKEWGTSEDATLRELTTHAANGPWDEILASHLKAMTELTAEIKELRDANQQYLRAAARSTQETLAGLNPDAGTYTSSGRSDSPADTSHIVDRDL
ncbi:transposase [Arthrobacter pigmenti]|uniref:Transposase n=1 Tax=Arthrobacter pigmenti TaxID=271432 RepID=A0A846RQ24_9MICC|nr:flagellar protein FlgN [Arthrobacter pigmenti]NJC21206.1 transposase [Arthrobacter pigmenti]